jgi:hypothetical protein
MAKFFDKDTHPGRETIDAGPLQSMPGRHDVNPGTKEIFAEKPTAEHLVRPSLRGDAH